MQDAYDSYVCCSCLSYTWDYKSVICIMRLLKVLHHPRLGSTGTCPSRDTWLRTACSRSEPHKQLWETTKTSSPQPLQRLFLRGGGEGGIGKHFPFEINENSSFSPLPFIYSLLERDLDYYHVRRQDRGKATLVQLLKLWYFSMTFNRAPWSLALNEALSPISQ